MRKKNKRKNALTPFLLGRLSTQSLAVVLHKVLKVLWIGSNAACGSPKEPSDKTCHLTQPRCIVQNGSLEVFGWIKLAK